MHIKGQKVYKMGSNKIKRERSYAKTIQFHRYAYFYIKKFDMIRCYI